MSIKSNKGLKGGHQGDYGDPEQASSVEEILQGNLTDDAIESIMVEHLESDAICAFDASITTTVTMSPKTKDSAEAFSRTIEKKYDFFQMPKLDYRLS